MTKNQNIVNRVKTETISQVGNRPEREISLMVKVKDKRKHVVKTKCIFDTGNTLRGTCAISSKFHKKLGVGFQEIKKKSIGTARKGASLVCLGVSNPIEVHFAGIDVKYLLTPRVLEDLHADLNISNLFLKRVQAKLDFSMKKTVLTIGDQSTELIQNLRSPEEPKCERTPRNREKKPRKRKREKSSGPVHLITALKDVKCKPNSITFVPIRKQKGMFRVYPLDQDSTCQPIGAVYKNTDRIAFLNLGEEKQKMFKDNVICGMQYVRRGEAEPREERIDEVRTETNIDPGSTEEEAKVQELWTQLQLDENQMLAERPDLRQKVWQVLKKQWTVFS